MEKQTDKNNENNVENEDIKQIKQNLEEVSDEQQKNENISEGETKDLNYDKNVEIKCKCFTVLTLILYILAFNYFSFFSNLNLMIRFLCFIIGGTLNIYVLNKTKSKALKRISSLMGIVALITFIIVVVMLIVLVIVIGKTIIDGCISCYSCCMDLR